MVNRVRSQATVEALFFPPAGTVPIASFPSITEDLDAVFASKSTSFRELIATIVYGKFLDPDYKPRENLYDCSPRALYENNDGIRPVFLKRHIPCGQSPALNIAKATSGLNEQWASQRRPKEHAEATLRIVDWIMAENEEVLEAFAAELGRRFSELALQSAQTLNSLPPSTSSGRLVTTCWDLITNHPDGGTIPQAICGIAIETEFLYHQGFSVFGSRDSVSTTNRTSNKVGDVSVEDPHGNTIRIYEITVKSFNTQRINEAVQSLSVFFKGEIPAGTIVQVLCRPMDIPPEATANPNNSQLAEFEQDGVLFQFINVYSWLIIKVAEFDLTQRTHFFNEVQDFLNTGKNGRISGTIRQAWAAGFSE